MKRVLNVAGSVLGIAALVVLAAALLLTFGGLGERQVAQEPVAVDTSRGSFQPPPDTPTVVPYPPPWIPTQTPTGMPYPPPMPTETPVPTFPPATETPVLPPPPAETPLPTPAPGYAGIERKVYVPKAREGEELYYVRVEDGKPVSEVKEALGNLGIFVVDDFGGSKTIVVSSTPGVIERALTIPGVKYAEPIISSTVPPYDAETDASWQMKRVEAMIVHHAGYKGDGIEIANVDTGVDYTHPDLQNPNAWRSYSNLTGDGGGSYITEPCLPPTEGVERHGQRVSGVVIGADNDDPFSMVGIAPDADYWMLRVYWRGSNGVCGTDDNVIASAIYAAINSGTVDVITIEAIYSANSQKFHDAISDALAAGLIVTIPAGNEAPMTYPALWGDGIIVAAVDEWIDTSPVT